VNKRVTTENDKERRRNKQIKIVFYNKISAT